MNELKPCPFCGGTAEMKFGPASEYVYVECKTCGARTKIKERSVKYCATDEAAKAWNRRADDGGADMRKTCDDQERLNNERLDRE